MRRAPDRTSRGLGGIFYGWWMVIGGTVGMALSTGLNYYGFSAFLVPLSKEFGWSRTALSGVFSLSQVEGGILGPIEGYFVDKVGPRKIMLVGIPLMGLGFVLLSRVDSLLALYLVYILAITLGSSLSFSTPVTAAVANWFVKKRSRAFGILMSGVSLGGVTSLPLLAWMITTQGWRFAAAAAGVLIITVCLPLALIMRHRPEQYGCFPDGEIPSNASDSPQTTATTTVRAGAGEVAWQPEFSAMQSLKTSAFWLFGIALALRSVVTTGITIHFVAMMVDRGFSLVAASSLLGSVALLSVVGRVGLSWLGDFADKRRVLVAATMVMALATAALSLTQAFWLVAPILVVYSVAYGGVVVLPMALQADYFGRHAYATIRGLMHTVQTMGTLAGPLFAGLVYDITNSYTLAFAGFAAAGVMAGLMLMALRKPLVFQPGPLGS